MNIIKLFPKMTVELKKPHPCGGHFFTIMRVGSICRIVCQKCGRDMDMDRLKLEKAIKKCLTGGETEHAQKNEK